MARLFANDTIGPSAEYQEQLRKEHDGSKWGSTGGRYSGADIVDVLHDRRYLETVLDFGAGKGTLGEYVQGNLHREIKWHDYDPGMVDIDVMPSGQFDCVVSSDVLEHVEPERLMDTLETLASKAKKVIITDIACYPTGKVFGEGPYIGQDMHLSIHEPIWWREQFDKLGLHLAEYEHRSKFSKGKYKDRCFMIHEKI